MRWFLIPILVLFGALMHGRGPLGPGLDEGLSRGMHPQPALLVEHVSERASNLDPGVDDEGLLSESVSESEHEPSADSSSAISQMGPSVLPTAIWDRPHAPVSYDAATGRDTRGPPTCRGPPIV